MPTKLPQRHAKINGKISESLQPIHFAATIGSNLIAMPTNILVMLLTEFVDLRP
jgi:hypothetical protein